MSHIFLRIRKELTNCRTQEWNVENVLAWALTVCVSNMERMLHHLHIHMKGMAGSFECMNIKVWQKAYNQNANIFSVEWNYPINFMSIPND